MVLVGVLAACGGGPSWEEVVDRYADAVCHGFAACGAPGEPEACIAEVQTDLAETRAQLPSEREEQCMDCLATVADIVPAVVDNGCESTTAQDARIYAACDLDPAVDYDGDGDPANDDEQACDGLR